MKGKSDAHKSRDQETDAVGILQCIKVIVHGSLYFQQIFLFSQKKGEAEISHKKKAARGYVFAIIKLLKGGNFFFFFAIIIITFFLPFFHFFDNRKVYGRGKSQVG